MTSFDLRKIKRLLLILIIIPIVIAVDDSDSDTVPDTWDVCKADTNLIESVPYLRLLNNRFALTDGDIIFDTKISQGKGPNKQYSLDGSVGASTCGCSCEQILSLHPKGFRGSYLFGCTIGNMDLFVKRYCEVDNDNDGFMVSQGDCDDNNPDINPGQEEVCNGLDDNCDGILPEDEADADGDGYSICEGDCDDQNPASYPAATEICDRQDNDCDGIIPEDEIDIDLDGMTECEGDCDNEDETIYTGAEELCDGKDNDCDGVLPETEVDNDGDLYRVCDYDCDDNNSEINVAAVELCDGIDNNCNLLIDEGFDADNDGYKICEGDCDDNDNETYPGFAEICDGKDNDCDGEIDNGVDNDGDGYESWYSGCGDDCNDNNAEINPASIELCDGIDNDCDGEIDEDVKLTFYKDEDGDGHGTLVTTLACQSVEGYAAKLGDCDDSNAEVNPDTEEVCDGIDNDCDGQIDEGIPTTTYYLDSDSDGFGSSTSIDKCMMPTGYVENSDDCDDTDPSINPAAEEECDDIDNNCDGSIDEDMKLIFFNDGDGDGYGGLTPILACTAPSGYEENSDDCNDADSETYPGATELCDGIDNNCNDEVDEGLPAITLYRDVDGDGFGSESIEYCEVIAGYTENSGDCDDLDENTYPGAAEICDDMDNDCDGSIDEGIVKASYYLDNDGDNFGSGAAVESCTIEVGYVWNSGDCDDSDNERYPGNEEICDGIDNDCDGSIDEGLGDNDGDGYSKCAGDCNDANAAIHPGATDIACDAIDQDCSGSDNCAVRFLNKGDGTILDIETGISWLRDADCIGPVYYEDSGEFGVGALTKVAALGHGQCGLSDGSGAGDWRIPTLNEIKGLFRAGYCEDKGFPICLGNAAGSGRWQYGDPFVDVLTWDWDRPYLDPIENYYWTSTDVDGWCNQKTVKFNFITVHSYGSTITYDYITLPSYLIHDKTRWYNSWDDGIPDCCCNFASGWAWPVRDNLVDNDNDGYTSGPDCDDSNSEINPGMTDICDGIDNDCDGLIDETCDYDDDSYSVDEGDCDDANAQKNPGAEEVCDGIDNDCDGQTDEGLKLTFYRDDDGDGYGGSSSTQACSAPDGYVSNSGDCNDNDASINPSADDPCDGVDNNCDGILEDRNYYFRDADGDGYGNFADRTYACSLPEGYLTTYGDCDDTDPEINPGAVEICDSKNNDCDAYIDEGVRTTVYRDSDRDGFGSSVSGSRSVCGGLQGYVTNNDDCDDNDDRNYPGNTEVCDNRDNDCDGEIDEDGIPCRFIDQNDGTILDTHTNLYWIKDAGCLGGDFNYPSIIYNLGTIEEGICGLNDNSWKGAWSLPTSDEMMNLCGYCGLLCYLGNSGETGSWSQGNSFNNIMKEDYEAYWTSTPVSSTNQKLFRFSPMCTDKFSMAKDYSVYFTYYAMPVRSVLIDQDGDGHLVLESTGEGPDCDDSNAEVYPGHEELCNHIDDNCVDDVDEVCDWDGDGYTPNQGDCDDDNPDAHPGLIEQMNGMDDNCDGKIDERFSIIGDGTVRDNIYGWYWLQDAKAIPESTFNAANEIIANLQDSQYGLSDGSSPGDWELPTRMDLFTLRNSEYAYDNHAEGNCKVVNLPYYYERSWETIPNGPAVSNGQGDRPWREGDAFLHLDDHNPYCSRATQNLCELLWVEAWIVPYICAGQPSACNHNLFWTSNTMVAYDWFVMDDEAGLLPSKECNTCTGVFGDVTLDVAGYFYWEDPIGLISIKIPLDSASGTCCVAYDLNRGQYNYREEGYYCNDKLKVLPVKKG